MAQPLIVKIIVSEGKDLVAADPNGFSDPYCVLSVGQTQFKTAVRNKTLDPIWNESFTADFTRDKTLTISVWDKDLVSADDFLGQVVIDVGQVPLDGSATWRTLQARPGRKDKVKGVLKVSFVKGNADQLANSDVVLRSGSTAIAAVGGLSNAIKQRITTAKKEESTVLDLTGLNLTVLPSGITESAEWSSIDLGFNKLADWPDNLGLFKYLTELFMSGNQLTSISPKVGELVTLRALYLNGNFITSMSPEICKLTNLEKLDLSNNALKKLPAEIGMLERLEELSLSGNPLSEGLPPEMGKLEFLVTLHLNACTLTELPVEFVGMSRLLELDLGTNALTQLPAEMGNLTRLVTLNLSDNQLTDLPMSMGKCVQLDSCQLERNPIKNEELMKKYRVGTDHLADYLEKRLFAYEQEKKRRERTQAKKKKKRPPIPTGDRPSLSEFVGEEEQKEDPDAKLSPEERYTKMRFTSQKLAHTAKQDLIELKKALMLSKTLEECVPIAKAVRDLKNTLEEARTCILPVERPKPPPLFPNETKLQQLKKTTAVAMKEVELVVIGIMNTLSTLISNEQVQILSRITRAVSDRILEINAEIKAGPAPPPQEEAQAE